MTAMKSDLVIIIDDREWVPEVLRNIVGHRRFGDITLRRRKLYHTLVDSLPISMRDNVFHLIQNDDCKTLHDLFSASKTRISAFVISTRAAFPDSGDLEKLVLRLPYAYENFTDKRFQPLLAYFYDMHDLIVMWDLFSCSPITRWEKFWNDEAQLEVNRPIDLAKISDFLQYSSGSTETRHFNSVKIDSLYYTKSSEDRNKMKAEYCFYHLASERMKPWFVETFDFKEDNDQSSYRMMRYYFADAALQWIHNAFTEETFLPFIQRIMAFLSDRPQKAVDRDEMLQTTRELYVNKVEKRIKQFLDSHLGQKINLQLSASDAEFEIKHLQSRYLDIYRSLEKKLLLDSLSFGHGDPCFSNILYDQTHHFLKFIDPKGAVREEQLWTHPFYDICKISHSVLGNYDFINNDLFQVSFDDKNRLCLDLKCPDNQKLKNIFIEEIKKQKLDIKLIRLCEASLFLSMLPLHLDHPNKVMAFILTAKKILDEVQGEQ